MLRSALIVLVAAAAAPAADSVPVDGSSVRFPRSVAVQAGGKAVTLNLTGTALRTRLVFSVYAIGSYLQDGVPARSADDILKADAAKMLYIVMERSVPGKEFLDAVRTAVLKGRPASAFAAEFAQLDAALASVTAEKGDHVSLTSVPGTGLRVQIIGKADVTVKNAEFAQAVWQVYLGPTPIDERLKAGLVSLLGR